MFRHSNNYSVKLTGRAGLVYSEGSKHMFVDSELLAGPTFDIVVFGDSIKSWAPPHQSEAISAEDVLRIRGNIAEALNSMRVDWQ